MMPVRNQFYAAFVLHTRHYRDTSLLIEFFTSELGRISAVARGARSKRNPVRNILQPFIPLLISLSGKNPLLTLNKAETPKTPHLFLTQKSLLSGLYLNELLMRVLMHHDPHPHLYDCYEKTIAQLSETDQIESVLRIFEKELLAEVGYALPLEQDIAHGEKIIPERFYIFYPHQGFMPADPDIVDHENLFSGKTLISLASNDLHDPVALSESKRLLRMALAPLIGDKPLQTRRLFISKEDHKHD